MLGVCEHYATPGDFSTPRALAIETMKPKPSRCKRMNARITFLRCRPPCNAQMASSKYVWWAASTGSKAHWRILEVNAASLAQTSGAVLNPNRTAINTMISPRLRGWSHTMFDLVGVDAQMHKGIMNVDDHPLLGPVLCVPSVAFVFGFQVVCLFTLKLHHVDHVPGPRQCESFGQKGLLIPCAAFQVNHNPALEAAVLFGFWESSRVLRWYLRRTVLWPLPCWFYAGTLLFQWKRRVPA